MGKLINKWLTIAILCFLFPFIFGLPSLIGQIFCLINYFKFIKIQNQSWDSFQIKKIKWIRWLSLNGLIFSLSFTIYYLIALFSGAFISFF